MTTGYVVRHRDADGRLATKYVKHQRPEGSVDTTSDLATAQRYSRSQALEAYYRLAHRLGVHKAVREWEVVPVTVRTEIVEGDPI